MRITGSKAMGNHVSFDSIGELVASVDRPFKGKDNDNSFSDGRDFGSSTITSMRPSPTWDCNAGWKGAVALARDGWRLEGKPAPCGMLSSPNGTIEFSETGDEVDAGLFVSGEPECFIQRVGEVAFRSEQLLVNVSYHCRTNALEIAAKAELLWNQIVAVRSEGVDFEIVAVCLLSSAGRTDSFAITSRNVGDAMESHQFMAAFHPAFLRRLIFRAHCDHCQLMYGHGTPRTDIDEVRKAFSFKGARYVSIASYGGEAIDKLPTL